MSIQSTIEQLLSRRSTHFNRAKDILAAINLNGIENVGVRVVDDLAAQRWAVDAYTYVISGFELGAGYGVSREVLTDVYEGVKRDLIARGSFVTHMSPSAGNPEAYWKALAVAFHDIEVEFIRGKKA